MWEYTEPDWDELRSVVTGHGPSTTERLALRARYLEQESWVRELVLRCVMPVFEVFRQERKGQPFTHAGSVVAPDAAFADAWAREQCGRRGESSALWLVPRDSVHAITEWADEFDLKYRRVDGYSIKERLRIARERAGTAPAEPR